MIGFSSSLYQLHTQVVSDFPAWDNRLELAYISRHALLNFRTQTSAIGIISPGEPFHLIPAGSDWLISWYALRETGIAQHGPPIQTLIKPMPLDAWLESVREHVLPLSRVCEEAARQSRLVLHRIDCRPRLVHAGTWIRGLEDRSGRMGCAGDAQVGRSH